jgi:Flp pilus assembly pilin Flp
MLDRSSSHDGDPVTPNALDPAVIDPHVISLPLNAHMDAQICSTFEAKSFHAQRPVWRSTSGKGGETDMELINTLAARLRKEEGQTMAEYAVVLAVICAATVAIFIALQTGIVAAITEVITAMA